MPTSGAREANRRAFNESKGAGMMIQVGKRMPGPSLEGATKTYQNLPPTPPGETEGRAIGMRREGPATPKRGGPSWCERCGVANPPLTREMGIKLTPYAIRRN